MNKKRKALLFILISFFLILETSSYRSIITASSLSTATVYVDPQTSLESSGHNFTIKLNISNVIDLYGWEFRLGWNTTLLDAVAFTEGSFLKSSGEATFFTYRIDNTGGYVLADCTLLGDVTGVNGNGTLATATFHVKTSGECLLDLYNVTLVDHNEEIIPSQAVDGYFKSATHDTAVTNVEVSTTIAVPGDIVDINIALQNQGDFTETFNVTIRANAKIIGLKNVTLDKSSSTTIPFTWNTTGFAEGDYVISAFASIVQGEVDILDNSRTANEIVTILYFGHDVAVVDIKPSKTIVGEGYCANITVTAKNYGSFTETFNVKLHADLNTTTFGDEVTIGVQSVILTKGNSAIIIFPWNTTGVVKGNYTVSANTTAVQGEVNVSNNAYVDGRIIVAVIGDITGSSGFPDGKVDMRDVAAVARLFGVSNPNPKYDPNCDLTGSTSGVADGKIDMKDVAVVAKEFGKIEQ